MIFGLRNSSFLDELPRWEAAAPEKTVTKTQVAETSEAGNFGVGSLSENVWKTDLSNKK